MRKKLTKLTTSTQWVQCECGNAHSHKKGCIAGTHQKFLVQSDVEDDSYWLCSYCAGHCVWNDSSAADDGMIIDLKGLGELLGRHLT